MKKIKVLLVGVLIAMSLTGCAAMENEIAKNGSLIGSTKGDYIVINTSGDLILDVYKLRDAYVNSETGSDGWSFIDNNGNVVMLGGDVKTIRVRDKSTWDLYDEYHFDEIFMQTIRSQKDN